MPVALSTNRPLQFLYIAEVFYMVSEMFTQLSILAFYLRVFPSERFQRVIYGVMGLVVCFGISNTVIMVVQCMPLSYMWTSWTGETEGHCIDVNRFAWYRAAIEIVLDLTIIALPMPFLTKLQMGWKKRLQVLLMFCVGFLWVVSNPLCRNRSWIR